MGWPLTSQLQSSWLRSTQGSGFTLFTDSEGGSHMTRGSMPMREPVPASWTRTYLGSAKATCTHADKSGFGFVEVYMQAKTIKS